ncbi:TonB-dependent receptor [Paenirhodobacter sp. CAU 1674]|uniref:TonB-dependent receptor domain-containing protein n=1 Tax=Paenirhodobacter sp. CAU 1674 TaxID=3032596 RepID=UPI0023DBEE58|nr:TonB-dependent receptor [Paenirhodobacter sp. CAU 1674]MDF2141899.1 TonB-dependent receptor [Paenirhodobacter sp. CAU 1674]
MKLTTLARLGASGALLCALSPAAFAQDADAVTALDPIYVLRERARLTAGRYEFTPMDIEAAPASDGGALLNSVPGVSINRMGGHGLDIVIRGQQANQLNVIDSGSFTYGGCPNRMDPPTSTLSLNRADTIIVEKGYASVTNGPGGSGGTVRLEREAPEFEEGKKVSGSLITALGTNGNTKEIGGTIAVDLGGGFYLEAGAEYKDADNYEDGDGREERSAYTQKNAGVTFGYKTEGAEIALDIERDKAEDVLFAGAGMDSPLSDTKIYRLRGGMDVGMGPLTRIEGNLFVTEVDHEMDNYTLRTPGMMLMRSPTTSDTHGGKVEGQFDFGTTTARIGLDYQSNNRVAFGYGGPASMLALIEAGDVSRLTSVSWPDVTISQTGLYAETETKLDARTTLKFGARYDHVRASAGLADGVAGAPAPAPNTLYTTYYGTTFDEARTEDNFGGLVRLEYELSPGVTLFSGLSRSVRTADASERAFARSNWIGNPDIAPEKHHQIDVGLEAEGKAWAFTATAFADRVNDYILRDQFTIPGVTTYRNVSATLAGVELGGSLQSGNWTLAGDVTYTYGQNRTDDRPLAQIPPLEGSVSATYAADLWHAGGRVNFASSQTRIDPSRDPGVSAGWATLDVFGGYALSEKAMLFAGVDNVFDKAYSNHLSRSNVFDSTMTRVMEPGRTVYVKLEAKF